MSAAPDTTPPDVTEAGADGNARVGRDRRGWRRLLLVVPVAALFAVAGVGLFRTRPDPTLGAPAPRFALESLETPGREIRLASMRGRPVILNFWASWCEPCKDEAPELAATANRFASEVTFLGVNILDGRDRALEYVEEFDIPFDNVRDPNASVAKRYGVSGAPETFFVAEDGTIVGRYIGAFEEGRLAELVERFLELRPGETLRITGRGSTRPVP